MLPTVIARKFQWVPLCFNCYTTMNYICFDIKKKCQPRGTRGHNALDYILCRNLKLSKILFVGGHKVPKSWILSKRGGILLGIIRGKNIRLCLKEGKMYYILLYEMKFIWNFNLFNFSTLFFKSLDNRYAMICPVWWIIILHFIILKNI